MKQSMLPIMLMVMLLLAGNVHAQVETADDLTETGIALYWENDFEGAIFQLNQALEINPRDVAALHYRCAIHRVYGNVMEALADCTFALQIDQNSGEAHSSYARLLAVLATLPADMEAALAEADLGVELAPESWLTHFNRGAVLSANEAYPEALDEYDEAIRLGMEHPHVFFNAGTVASFTLWDFQRGLRYWNPGLELYPDDPLMLFYRGSTIMNMGEFEVSL